jgi:hypothetical protein
MLTKYADFILEKYLLNESILNASDRFTSALKLSNSPLAYAILSKISGDYDLRSNYFDLGKDSEHISFIADAKASKIDREFVILNYSILSRIDSVAADKMKFDREKLYHPVEGEVGEVISKLGNDILIHFDDKGEKQFVTKAWYTRPTDYIFYNSNRQDIRTGRGLRALLTTLSIEFTDRELEELVNKFKSAVKILGDMFSFFEVVEGDDISHYYSNLNYSNVDDGELGNSCMASAPKSFFQIYVKNPEVCKLVILKDPLNQNKILGRALLWQLSSPEIMYMDRIYTTKPSDVVLFREFAKKNGWSYKSKNNNDDSAEVVDANGSRIDYHLLEVVIKPLNYTKYPYLDTLKYLKRDYKYYILSSSEDSEYDFKLTSTDGSWEDACESCNATGIQPCEQCDGNGVVECPECDGGYKACRKCDEDGEITCLKCDGEGEVDDETCEDCKGEGALKCEDCDGKGSTDCDRCDADGTIECDECYGRGQYACRHC